MSKFKFSDINEFYPTPATLAKKLLNKVDWTKVGTILEPSAGKGDLCRSIASYAGGQWKYRKMEKNEVDCIEADPNLLHILKGEGYRIVGNDFLQFQSLKKYDLCVMNPPFSNGDEHLLKAMSLMEETGGQIICILNAETLKNPYSNRRKRLVQKLNELEAVIEYEESAFADAERKTNVEVALIYVDIPAKVADSFIFDGLKRASAASSEQEETPDAMMSADWLRAMVDSYNMEGKTGIAIMKEWMALQPYIQSTGEKYEQPIMQLMVKSDAVKATDSKTINAYITELRLKYWTLLLKRPEIVSRMTNTIQTMFSSRVYELRNYEFDEFNIRHILMELQGHLNQGVQEAILHLFDELSYEHSWYPETKQNRHYFDGWATNKAHKVGMKVIMPCTGAYAESWYHETFNTYSVSEFISELELALNYLNVGIAERKDWESVIKQANEEKQTKNLEFTYFYATFYRKGTVHIRFKEEYRDLIDRLNIFASQHRGWLPPNYGKVSYAEMNEDERAVVERFQGQEAYEKVYANPSYYLPPQQCLLGT